MNISVRVDNIGETEGICQLVCKVNGVVVEERVITLVGSSGESVVFTTTFDEAGNNTIEVNELTGSLGVKGDTSAPEQIPLPSGEELGIPSGEVADISSPEVIEESSWTSGRNQWLIGGILGGCLICAAVLVYVILWRRRGISDNSA